VQLSLQSFTTMVQNAAAVMQGACAQALDLTVGSVLRAVLEASASIALWMQWLILQVLSMTRLSTSSGADVDSFVGDWSLTRQAAVAATGSVTFSRFAATGTALIVPGAQVKTLDGTQTFSVTTDTTNSLWNAGQGGYLVPAGVTSATVPVQAVNVGTQGNVAAGTIGLMASAVSGLDAVMNATAFTNGVDAQSDASLKLSFQGYIASLARGTPDAITYAAQSVQQGLSVVIAENTDTSGAYRPGWFVVTVDDGTGNPPSSLLSAVTTAVQAYRAVGTVAAVQGPTLTTANVNVALTLAAGAVRTTVDGLVGPAVTAYINGLGIGATLPYTRLAQVIYDAAPGQIADIPTLSINGLAASLTVGASGVIRAGTVTVA